MRVRCDTGYVMGIPEAVIHTTQEEARKIFEIAYMCEPPPDEDCAATANALIAVIPVTASIENPQEAESVKALAYRISRALIGNDLADALSFPQMNTTGTLFAWRIKQRFQPDGPPTGALNPLDAAKGPTISDKNP